MKKYISRATKRLAIVTLIYSAVLFIGVILVFAKIPNTMLSIVLIALGGLLGVLFFSCFLAEKSRALIIDKGEIVFPRGIDKNGKMVFQKTVVRMDEISSVESKFYKGDKIISGDCLFHILKLKNGTKLTVTLYAYGKEAEIEILEFIKNSIT